MPELKTKQVKYYLLLLMTVFTLAGCGGSSSSPTLISITVTPATTSILPGATLQFSATETFSDGSVRDVTSSVTWSSSNTAIASISNVSGSNGLATANVFGTTIITATSGSVSGSSSVTVGGAYVTNSGSGTLSVVDTTSNTVAATVGVGAAPRGLAVNVTANRAYVANSGNGTLSVIDTTSNTVVATVGVGVLPQGIAVAP